MLMDILEPMGAQFDRLRCEICQNLFLSPMNTGFLRHAVATVLTVYGIETYCISTMSSNGFCCNSAYRLRYWNSRLVVPWVWLAICCNSAYRLRYWNKVGSQPLHDKSMLQQCLPFTVLKLSSIYKNKWPLYIQLQQCLPFTVLKQHLFCRLQYAYRYVATVLTVYGIETVIASNGENRFFCRVATVLTVYGIETLHCFHPM